MTKSHPHSTDKNQQIFFTTRMSDPAFVALALMGVSLGTLFIVYVAEYVFGLHPCLLCQYQRIPFVITAAIGGSIWFLQDEECNVCPTLANLAGITFAAGSMIAAFHAGVEYGWWEGTADCVGSLPDATASIEDLRKAVMEAPVVRCDEAAWTFLGISMAGYNFLWSTLLASLSFLSSGLMKRESCEA